MPVTVESVDQSAVEAGNVADIRGEQRAEFRHRAGGVKAFHERVQARIERIEALDGGGFAGDRLEFQNDEITDPVSRQIVGAGPLPALQSQGGQVGRPLGRLGLRKVGLQRRNSLREGRADRLSEDLLQSLCRRAAETIGEVRACLNDPKIWPFQHEKEAMRLKRSEKMNGFSVARSQICCSRRRSAGTDHRVSRLVGVERDLTARGLQARPTCRILPQRRRASPAGPLSQSDFRH
ncbi:hypothetical protein GCM10025880_28810 [Methylorubrum aminovorans]|nr:hypothetical protein GCM10025880_28810 [Methylorubrum aminovorans]